VIRYRGFNADINGGTGNDVIEVVLNSAGSTNLVTGGGGDDIFILPVRNSAQNVAVGDYRDNLDKIGIPNDLLNGESASSWVNRRLNNGSLTIRNGSGILGNNGLFLGDSGAEIKLNGNILMVLRDVPSSSISSADFVGRSTVF
jgi:hypothetical protein